MVLNMQLVFRMGALFRPPSRLCLSLKIDWEIPAERGHWRVCDCEGPNISGPDRSQLSEQLTASRYTMAAWRERAVCRGWVLLFFFSDVEFGEVSLFTQTQRRQWTTLKFNLFRMRFGALWMIHCALYNLDRVLDADHRSTKVKHRMSNAPNVKTSRKYTLINVVIPLIFPSAQHSLFYFSINCCSCVYFIPLQVCLDVRDLK